MQRGQKANHFSRCAATRAQPPTVRQTDKETHNQCLTTNTHTDKTDTPHHSPSWALFTHGHHRTSAVNPIIPHIPVSQHYFMCFPERLVSCCFFLKDRNYKMLTSTMKLNDGETDGFVYFVFALECVKSNPACCLVWRATAPLNNSNEMDLQVFGGKTCHRQANSVQRCHM